MNKIILLIITIVLAVGIAAALLWQPKDKSDPKTSPTTSSARNIEKRDGIQYITINARGGYSPRVSEAEANIPTKLVVKTDNTYDCSAALAIRSINYRKTLSKTGEEIIDLGLPQVGELQGSCSMGMYDFVVHFK